MNSPSNISSNVRRRKTIFGRDPFFILRAAGTNFNAALLAGAIVAAAGQIPSSAIADWILPAGTASPEQLARIEVPFIENRGQFDNEVAFYARLFSGTVFVTDSEIVYSLSGKAVSANERTAPTVLRERPLGGLLPHHAAASVRGSAIVNSYSGTNSSERLATADVVSLGEVWPGISIQLSARSSNIEKVFTVGPGRDPSVIQIAVDGANGLNISGDGRLVITTNGGNVEMTAPVAFQIVNGKRVNVPVSYIVREYGYGFAVGSYDRSLPLVIDPLLASTFLGGEALESITALKVDSLGNVIITGWSDSVTYPTTAGAYEPTRDISREAFVTKIRGDLGAVQYSTYFGGSGFNAPAAVALDGNSNVIVAGWTDSVDYPTTVGAYNSTVTGRDVFVSKFSADLGSLTASTVYGGSGDDHGADLAIAADGTIYVAGHTLSSDIPTTAAAYDTGFNGTRDGFVIRFSSDLTSLLAATYLGGAADDEIFTMAFGPSGDLFVSGDTQSANFPKTAGAFDTTTEAREAFISSFSPSLQTLSASTLLGGSADDQVYAIGVAPAGDIYVVGDTISANFPATVGAFDKTFNGIRDAFIARVSNDLSTLLAASFIGGTQGDYGRGLVIDAQSQIYVTGATNSSDFPTTPGSFDRTYGGGSDAYIAKFSTTLAQIPVSTYVGGNGYDSGTEIALDNAGNITLVGNTYSADFPTVFGSYDTVHDDIHHADGFALKMGNNLSGTTLLVQNIDSTSPDGLYAEGSTVAITVKFTEAVIVDTAGGSPLLALNSGGIAAYSSGSGTDTLTMSYPVLVGQSAADLDYSNSGALTLNGATIKSVSKGEIADLTLPPPAAIGSLGFNRALVIDTQVNAPVITSPVQNLVTNNPLKPVQGTAEIGSTVTVLDGAATLGTAAADASGNWTVTPTIAYVDGTHSFTATATDLALHTSLPSAARVILVDTTPPVAPVILAPAAGAVITQRQITISGTATGEAGATVAVYVDDIVTGSTTVGPTGAWSFNNQAQLINGTHTASAALTDRAGNAGPKAANISFVIDGPVDTDGDGLTNAEEQQLGTDPNNPDTDHDGATDGQERTAGSNPLNPTSTPADLDGDGLSNANEATRGTNPQDPDSDDDGVSDGAEVTMGSNPLNPASNANDFDGDGLSNVDESVRGTDPHNADTDGDGTSDSIEVGAGSNPTNPASTPADLDGDGLSNTEEAANGTDPNDADSDDDGSSDGQEVQQGTDPHNPVSTPPNPDGGGGGTSGGALDSDHDGITDTNELIYGTNPFKADTDNDDVSDSQERLDGTDPLDRGSVLPVLKTTVCAEWNGFLGMFNIMEHVNMSARMLQITTTLYSIDGVPQSTKKFSIAPGAQFDLLVHDMGGRIADSYGKVCSTHDGVAGDLDGRMVYYKTAPTGAYEFAFAMPYSNGIKGTQSVPFNTYQPSLAPSEANNPVANWIQLTNPNGSAQAGTLSFYSPDGALLAQQRIDLPGGARRDFAGHQFGKNLVGVTEWKPDDQSIPFLLRNVRYFYATPNIAVNSFSSAAQFSAQPGSGKSLVAPLDTAGSSAIVEISNIAEQFNDVTADVYNASGTLLKSLQLHLAPHASFHLITDSLLQGGKGIVVVKGSLQSATIATAMHYGRDSSLALLYMYGAHATETLGVNLRGSYNTFLSQQCSLLLMNPNAAAEQVTIGTTRYDGTRTLGNGLSLAVPGHGLLDFNLCNKDLVNVYGVVTVQPEHINRIGGTVVRLGPSDQYRFPTELRQ